MRYPAPRLAQGEIGLLVYVRDVCFGYNAAAPGTKSAVANSSFAAGAYRRHTRRYSLCSEEKRAANNSWRFLLLHYAKGKECAIVGSTTGNKKGRQFDGGKDLLDDSSQNYCVEILLDV